MISDDERGADVEFSDQHVEVRLVIKTDGVVATGRILDVTQNVLGAALTALNVPRVERTLEIWHESMAAEAREAEDI